MAISPSTIARAVAGRSTRLATFDLDLRKRTGQWYLAERIPLADILADFAAEDAFVEDGVVRIPLHESSSGALTGEHVLVELDDETVVFHDPAAGRRRRLPIDEIERAVPAWRARYWTDAYEVAEPPPFVRAETGDPAPVPSVPGERTDVESDAFFEAVRSELVSMRERQRERMRSTFTRMPVGEYPEEHGGISDVRPDGRSVDEYGQQIIALRLPDDHPLADVTSEELQSRTRLQSGDEVVIASPAIEALPVEAELFSVHPDGLEIGVYWDSAKGTHAEDAFDADASAVFTVGKLIDGRRFGSVAAAIDSVDRTEHARRRYGGAETTPVEAVDLDLGEAFNAQQRTVVSRGVAPGTDVLCVQSPPWTGVRRTIWELARRAVAEDERVLVLSPDADTVARLVGPDGPWSTGDGPSLQVGSGSTGSATGSADVLVRPIGAANDVPDHDHDLAIVDQAARIDVPTGAVPFAKAGRVVLFGDPWQGSPPHALGDSSGLVAPSIFEHLLAADRTVRLRTQHRMHRAIARFPNERFYDGAIVHGQRNRGWRIAAMDPLDAHHVEADVNTTPTGSVYHDVEIERIVDEVAALRRRGLESGAIGVLTPYSAQVGKVRVALEELESGLRDAVLVGGIDAFRCRGRDAVIVSFVGGAAPDQGLRNEAAGFAAPTGLNVAMTRAAKRLVLIGDWSSIPELSEHHEALASFIRKRGLLA